MDLEKERWKTANASLHLSSAPGVWMLSHKLMTLFKSKAAGGEARFWQTRRGKEVQ